MPSIRIGFSTDFNLLNELVGIGTTLPTARLDVAGQIRADNTTGSGGISTLTRYDGFSNSSQTLGNTVSIAETSKGNLNSISGEIIIPDGKTITVTDGVPLAAGRLDSLTVLKTFDLPSGGTSGRIATPEKGSTRYNEDLGQLEFYTGYEWRTVGSYDGSGRGRGVFGGFESPGTSIIDYVNIASTGNAIDFGVMDSNQGQRGSGCSSSTRGLFMGGSSPAGNNVISYITLASNSNGIDFGDLSTANVFHNACCASSTRGLRGGGSPGPVNVIDYVQISTIGNALDFGDLTVNRERFSSLSSSTRGIWAGGYNAGSGGPALSIIDFVTIASTGNAVSFGSLDRQADALSSCANNVRGLWVGGTGKASGGNWNLTSYITLASTGNAIYFGDLIGTGIINSGSLASQTRGVFAGGGNPTVNTISYVQIATTGNSQDFGDLTNARRFIAGLSDSHGGLGGF